MADWYFLVYDKFPTRSGFGFLVSFWKIKLMLSLLDYFNLFSHLCRKFLIIGECNREFSLASQTPIGTKRYDEVSDRRNLRDIVSL